MDVIVATANVVYEGRVDMSHYAKMARPPRYQDMLNKPEMFFANKEIRAYQILLENVTTHLYPPAGPSLPAVPELFIRPRDVEFSFETSQKVSKEEKFNYEKRLVGLSKERVEMLTRTGKRITGTILHGLTRLTPPEQEHLFFAATDAQIEAYLPSPYLLNLHCVMVNHTQIISFRPL